MLFQWSRHFAQRAEFARGSAKSVKWALRANGHPHFVLHDAEEIVGEGSIRWTTFDLPTVFMGLSTRTSTWLGSGVAGTDVVGVAGPASPWAISGTGPTNLWLLLSPCRGRGGCPCFILPRLLCIAEDQVGVPSAQEGDLRDGQARSNVEERSRSSCRVSSQLGACSMGPRVQDVLFGGAQVFGGERHPSRPRWRREIRGLSLLSPQGRSSERSGRCSPASS